MGQNQLHVKQLVLQTNVLEFVIKMVSIKEKALTCTRLLSSFRCFGVFNVRMLISCTILATSGGIDLIEVYNLRIFRIGKKSNHLC